jgi:exonuclease SbcC
MRIESVTLENFKSHLNSKISFGPGLNLILGPNGSGKSSILQAIGFAFFGIKADVQRLSQLITDDGEKIFSRIIVEFISNDGIRYKVTKEISADRNSKTYLEDQNGLKIDNLSKVSDKISELLEIRSDEPDRVYRYIITAYQNQIIDIFSQDASRRKPFFNSLFDTEIYKSISEVELRNYAFSLNDKAIKIQSEKDILENELKKGIFLDDEIKKIEDELKTASMEMEKMMAEKITKDEFIKNQDALTGEIKDLQSNQKLVESTSSQIMKNIEKISAEQIEAENAKRVVETFENDHTLYIHLEDEIKKIELKIKDIRKTIDELDVYKTQIRDKSSKMEKMKWAVDSEKETLDLETKRVESGRTEILSQKEKIKKIEREVDEKESKYKTGRLLRDRIKSIMNGGELEKVFEIVESPDHKKDFDETNNRMKLQRSLETSLKEIEARIIETTSKLKELEEAKLTLSNGSCPYLKERCQNIKGDPAGYFDPKIKIMNDAIIRFEDEKTKVENEISTNKKLEERKREIIEKIFEELSGEVDKSFEESSEAKVELKSESAKLIDMEKEIDALVLSIDDHRSAISKNSEFLSRMEKEIEVLSSKISRDEELRNELNDLELSRSALQKKIENVKTGYDLYNQNKKIADKTDRIIAELEEQRAEREKVEKKLLELNAKVESLSKHFDGQKVNSFRLEIESLNKNIKVKDQHIGELKATIRQKYEMKEDLLEKQKILEGINETLKKIEKKRSLSSTLQKLLNDMGSKISETYRRYISSKATENHTMLTNKSDEIRWGEEYDINLIPQSNTKASRPFYLLSGGEQITVSLSMRMGLAEYFSRSKFAIFDEPTVNLDEERRNALSESLPALIKEMDQVIVVTHDSTFKEMAEKVIILKNENGTTIVQE